MIESISQDPKPVFEKGMLVAFRKDAMPDQVKRNFEKYANMNAMYRVLGVEKTDMYGEIVWLGPSDMSQRSVDDFQPSKLEEDPRYDDVFWVVTEYLRTAHN